MEGGACNVFSDLVAESPDTKQFGSGDRGRGRWNREPDDGTRQSEEDWETDFKVVSRGSAFGCR